MKTIFVAISFITVVTLQVFSQVEIKVFEKMAGVWQGFSESGGEKYKEGLSMKWIFNHNFFEIDIGGETNNDNIKSFDKKGREIYTLDNGGKLTGWMIDNKGFSHMLDLTGTFDESRVIITGTNAISGCSIIYELQDKNLIRKFEYNSGGNEIEKSEIVYASLRSDYDVHNLNTKFDKIGEPGLAYVCHLSEDFVTVFDTKTNELVGKIPGGRATSWMCFSEDGYNGYITNYQSGTLTVFDRKTNETNATVGAGENPTFLLPVKNKILISHQSGDGIWILDTYSNTIVKRLNEGTGPLYLINSENKIYQPQIFTPYLFIIDPVKLEIRKKIKTGGRPMEMAFVENQKYAYMVNYDFDEVTKFDTKTDNVVKSIKDIKHPRGIASSPDGKLVYVSNVVDGLVYVIDTGTDSLFAVIEGFRMPVSITFTADGKYAYVLNQSESVISIIDTKQNTIIQSFYVASNPISILIDSR